MTATTEVVISEKSKPELRRSDFSGIAVSRMSTMRMDCPFERARARLLYLDVRLADHLAPLVDLELDLPGELLRRVADDLEPELLHLGGDIRRFRRLDDLLVDEIRERLRHPGRHQHGLEGV